MSGFTVETEGFEQAIRLVEGVSMKSQTWGTSSAGRDILLLIQADVDERFAGAPAVESGGLVYGGVMWKPVSPEYLESNPRRAGGQLLRDTGELLQSFTAGGAGNISERNPQEVTFGSALPKARGLNRDRPLLVVHDELLDNVEVLLVNHLIRP